jgi:hypothetical protein
MGMSKKFVENPIVNKEKVKDRESRNLKKNYQSYLALGGIINETDYRNAFDRTRSSHLLDRKHSKVIRGVISQVLEMAKYADITLHDSEYVPDPRIVLYVTLRNDAKPKDVNYHHSQMSDQQLFGEVLIMLGDSGSFNKLIKAYPNISFIYKKEK